jgi:DNA polymerase-3 subunit gamma/tau
MRDAESLLDQVVSFTGPKVENKHVTETLGIIDRDIIFQASLAIIEGDSKTCIELVEQIYNYGYDIKEFYRALMDQFRNLVISLIASQNHLLDMTESEKEEARHQAEMAGSEKLQVALNFLITREGDLRSTTHPRLILETTMIKLCHLGEFVSFGELLIKLESLEKRLTSTLTKHEQPNTSHISDPDARWVSEGGEKAQEEVSLSDSVHTWDDFLTFLSSKNKAMFNILKDWRLQRLTEKTLEIAKGNQSFSSSYFDDPEKYDQLSAYCRDFFKRTIHVKIVNNNQPLSQEKETAQRKYSDLPPPVQDILHIFQGEIKEGHPAAEAGHDSSKQAEKKKEENK